MQKLTLRYSQFINLVSQTKFYHSGSKIVKNAQEALEGIKDGHTVLFGGFGLAGIPENSILELRRRQVKNLTAVSNTGGISDWGLGLLLQTRQISKMIASYLGENPLFEKQFLNGEIEMQLTPQGTLAEKLRCGAAGIPAFFTGTGVGTWVESGQVPMIFDKETRTTAKNSTPKEKRVFGNREYILEEAIRGDFGLIKAKYADEDGNLYYYRSANNFNQDLAGASTITVAEVEEIVPRGFLSPDKIHTPGIYVDRVYKMEKFEKKIERYRFSEKTSTPKPQFLKSRRELIREKIAGRAAKELKTGMYVNLGIGIPTMVPNYVDKSAIIMLQSENGVLGVGGYPTKGNEHSEIINASKETISLIPGTSICSSATSFGIIRGGHLDVTILGAMQISQNGDIANWIIPGKKVTGMGGGKNYNLKYYKFSIKAMDLVSSGSRVIVCMQHNDKKGEVKKQDLDQLNQILNFSSKKFKLVEKCTLPLTGKAVVDTLVTEKAVFKRIDGKMVLTDIASEYTLEEIRELTGFQFETVPIDQIGVY